jgi:drug/metabolite transporter (DMT)-like permease
MTRRGAALFALMSLIWGIPYLLIRVAVRDLSPATVVAVRTALGAIILLPLAWRQARLAPLLRRWKPLAAYSVCELAIPWYLLSSAETKLNSSLSGLLVATVPLISAVLAWGAYRELSGVDRRSLGGLLVGLAGVAVLLGFDVHGSELISVLEVLGVAVGYALGPFIAVRYLSDQSSLALAAASLAGVAIVYVPIASTQLPAAMPGTSVILSVVVLGVVCTALAFVAFFELIKEMPPTKATVITYFNPVVAVVLGVAVLGEPFKPATAAGFLLVVAGSWASSFRSTAPSAPAVPPVSIPGPGGGGRRATPTEPGNRYQRYQPRR